MAEVKEIITILCKCLQYSIDSTLTPEHFLLSKYDKNENDVINTFWTVLDEITFFALKDIGDKLQFNCFNKISRTKLRMSFLQYPTLEFYSLPETTNNTGSRILLIAFSWLIAKFDVLNDIIKLRIIDSPFGKEFSQKIDKKKTESVNDANLSTVTNQVNNLLHKVQKLSCNLKAISELHTEKVKLAISVHAASLNTNGLPHLTVTEMALVKKIVTNKSNNNEELLFDNKIKFMMDYYTKWTNKNHIFFTWMNTVIDAWEQNKELNNVNGTLEELSKFIYLLRTLIKKRIKVLKKEENDSTIHLKKPNCPTRLLRVKKDLTKIQDYLKEGRYQIGIIDNNLREKKTNLNNLMQDILSTLPNCHQIN